MLKYFLIAVFFIIIFLIYSHRLFSSFIFHPDFARDIYDLVTIIQGKPTLIGPKLSFGGFFSAPYYYYLFVPVFFITKLNINSLLAFNLLLFILALLFFFFKIKQKHGVISSFLATLIISFSPFYLTFARGPWHGSTYLPFLLIFLVLLYFSKSNISQWRLFFLGLLAGLILSTHIVNATVIIPAIGYLLYLMKRRWVIIFFLLGIIIAFLPLFIFELKHDFIMTKNTLLVGSFQSFIQNKNLPDAIAGKKNALENIFFVSKHISSLLGIPIFFLALLFMILLKMVMEKRGRFLLFSSLALVLLLAFVLRYQFSIHYLFTIALFIIFTVCMTILNTRFRWLLIIVLLFELYSFPKSIYNASDRKPEAYKKAVNYVINRKLIQKNESFNIFQYSKKYKSAVPIGHEYRFFFKKYGFIPKNEFEYNSSDTLLIFSEVENLNVMKLNSWEIDQFGKQFLKKNQKYQIGEIILYKISKEQNSGNS